LWDRRASVVRYRRRLTRKGKAVAILSRRGDSPIWDAESGWATSRHRNRGRLSLDNSVWTMRALKLSKAIGFDLPKRKSDQRVKGRYVASHAEMQLMAFLLFRVLGSPEDFDNVDQIQELLEDGEGREGSDKAVIKVNKPPCSNCLKFARCLAKYKIRVKLHGPDSRPLAGSGEGNGDMGDAETDVSQEADPHSDEGDDEDVGRDLMHPASVAGSSVNVFAPGQENAQEWDPQMSPTVIQPPTSSPISNNAIQIDSSPPVKPYQLQAYTVWLLVGMTFVSTCMTCLTAYYSSMKGAGIAMEKPDVVDIQNIEMTRSHTTYATVSPIQGAPRLFPDASMVTQILIQSHSSFRSTTRKVSRRPIQV
ncbi:hypothetical protein FRC17_005353, partial [Serendipita sp. 399]